MSNIIKNTAHVTEAKARVPGFLKDAIAPNFNKIIKILADRYQGLENELDDLLNNVTDVAINAIGAQLNIIGVIVDRKRIIGESDDLYRIRLLAQAARLAKSGEPEAVIDAYKLITLANRVLLVEFDPISIELTAFVDDDDFTIEEDQAIIDSMNEVIAAAIGTSLLVQENPDQVFLWGDTADADANGDISLDVDHGLGDVADADANGDIPPGLGEGGKIARVLTGIQIINFQTTPLEWYQAWREPTRKIKKSTIPGGFIADSPFPFP